MPHRGRNDIPIKVGAGGWDGSFTVEKPVLKEGYVLASRFNQNEAQKLANIAHPPAASAAPKAAAAPAPPLAAPKEITHSIRRETADDTSSGRDQLDSNGSDFHGRASYTEVLPTQWDGKFAPGGGPPRVRPSQHTNTNNFYGYTNEPEVLPARWDGKFAPGGGGASYRPKPSQHTNTNNFYGYTTEPEVLPVQWDGKFAQGTEVRIKPDANRSDFRQMYGVNTEPTVLPAQWDGKFAPAGPDNVYYVPERNQSLSNDFYGQNNETVVLPTQWSGKFELDPNDVRVRPERNESDVRDYADHRNFREVKN